MTRWIALSLAGFVSAMAGAAEIELPRDDDYESFEVEPPNLVPNREIDDAAAVPAGASAAAADRLEREVERAKKTAQNAERLFRIGVLAKVEVEQRALRVVRLQSDLENARLARAKEEMAQKEALVAKGEINKSDMAETERMLAAAVVAAETAAANRERAEIAAAEANVRRQQKLASLGSARKSDVSRAEKKLAELKANIGN